MSVEIWILIVLGASAGSAWLAYSMARRGAPSQAQLDALAAELDGARQEAESVQSNVSEHFEQSAMLFGKLAKDYREFLEHFSTSAQALGVSESRALELLEQGYQPLITHEDVGPVEDVDKLEDTDQRAADAAQAEDADQNEATTVTDGRAATGVADVVVEMPEEVTDDSTTRQQASS